MPDENPMPSTPRRFAWWREAPVDARRALTAAAFGWMLDSFDVMLYALVLSALIAELGIAKPTAGLLGSLTLVASAFGGLIFGLVADRHGRRRALMASILIYSVFTAACGLASGVVMLAVFRICLGLGMGGEWASGVALVSETWPAAHRGKALGLVQSAWAVGYAAAAAVSALVMPRWGWRAVFFVGVVPAFFTLWVQRRVKDPEIWRDRRLRRDERGAGLRLIFGRGRLRLTVLVTAMNALTLFAWWGLNLWIPSYLSLSAAPGRRRAEPPAHVRHGHLHAGRDVAGLRQLRLHQRPGRPEEGPMSASSSRPRCSSSSTRRRASPSSSSSSARSWPISARATSAASAR